MMRAVSAQAGCSGGRVSAGTPQRWAEGGTADVAFDAVLMKGALARGIRRQAGHRGRHEQVAGLGMQQAVQESAMDEDADADAGADGDVDERVQPLAGAPEMLAEHRRIDIGVERHGHLQAVAEKAEQVGLLPAGFRCCRDAAKAGAGRVEVERAKAADAERGEVAVLRALRRKPLGTGGQRLRGCCRREAGGGQHLIGTATKAADKLGAAGLDGGEERSLPGVMRGGRRRNRGCRGWRRSRGWPGLVEGVEVDAVDAVVEQVAALLGGVVDADARTASSSPPQRWMARSSGAG
jgi:hypothetical protein